MIGNIGTYTLTGHDFELFKSITSTEHEGYSLGNFRDTAVLGASARDYWASRNEDMQKAAAAWGQSVETILNASTGVRSMADFFSGNPVEANNDEIPVNEFGLRENNSITTEGGLTITVSTLRDLRKSMVNSTITVNSLNGLSFSFDARDDVRIQENPDGTILVNYPQSGKSFLYSTDGSMKEAGSSEGWESEADCAYIKLSKESSVVTGAGNDIILVIEDGGSVSAGAGNDTLVIGQFAGGKIHIDAGDGDDSVRAFHIGETSSIHMGDGNDSIITHINSGLIDLGNGDNKYQENDTGRSWSQTGKVLAGDGNNEIISRMASNIELGNGNNTIYAQFIENMQLGNGVNTITSEHINGLISGDGNNTIESAELGNTKLGNGNNQIIADSFKNYSTVVMGDGDNEVTVRKAYRSGVAVGNGNNSINISDTSETVLDVGHGNNDIAVGKIHNISSINVGNGDNTIITKSIYTNASITIGNGNNIVGIGSISGHDNTINIGDGDNIIAAMWHPLKKHSDPGSPSVTIGNGNNQIYLEENFQMNIGTGANNFYNYALNSGGYNAIQSWIDTRLSKLA